MSKVMKVAIVFVLVFMVSVFVWAQRQTGSVAGEVTDDQDAPLPGASVTLKGPALMGELTYVTSEGGDFRFPAVPPGRDYVILVEMPGFKVLNRGGIIVSVGKTSTINVQLEATTLQEEVTVVAESPTVDVTSSKISVNYDSDMIKNIPLARDYYDVINTAPGIVSENVNFHRTFSAHGSTVRNNQVTVDGISMKDPGVGTNMVGLPFDTFEEIEFELGSHPAEVGMADGAYVNIITKSGGNDFHGTVSAYYFNDSMVKSLIPEAEAQSVGLNEPQGHKSWADLSLALGGPIVKDKLWFFVNGHYIDWTLEQENFEGLYDATRDEYNLFGKLTFKPHPNWKITGLYKLTNWSEPLLTRGANFFRAKENLVNVENAKDHSVLAQINWIADQNTFFDLRFNFILDKDPWDISPDADPNAPYVIDIASGFETGSTLWNEDYTSKRYAFTLSATRFLDNVLGGNHEIKAGLEYERTRFIYDVFKPYPVIQLAFLGQPYIAPPFVGLLIGVGGGAKKGDVPFGAATKRFSAYLQDSFTIGNRLTLNLGLRYDETHGNVPGVTISPALASDPVFSMLAPANFTQHTVPEFKDLVVYKDLSPRVGVVYDLFGDGKTSLRASWARYNDYLFHTMFIGGLAHIVDLETLWLDFNLNGIPDTTDGYIPQAKSPNPSTHDPSDSIDPSLKSPFTNEFVVGIERELFKDFNLGLNLIYKKKERLVDVVDRFRGNDPNGQWWIPYTVTDPGWDGQFGTGDDVPLTVSAVKAGAPLAQNFLTNPRGAERKYKAIELIFQKRMSNRWQLLGSLTLSKYEGNVDASYWESAGNQGPLFNPNNYVNGYGRVDMDRPVQIKLQGSVQLPLDFMLSAYYFHFSGVPWQRTVSVMLPPDPAFDPSAQLTFVDVNAETPGSRRRLSRNNLDIRLEKNFNVGSFGRLGVFLDVLNALGERWFDLEQNPGGFIYPGNVFVRYPTFGQFTAANGLRTFKLSARFSF